MKTQLSKSRERSNQTRATTPVQQRPNSEPTRRLENNRPQAVAQQKLQQAAFGGSVVQRNKESQDLLHCLTTPQVFDVPDAALQKDIAEGMNKQIAAAIANDGLADSNAKITFVGAVELKLPANGKTDLESWVKEAQLIDLSSKTADNPSGHALGEDLNTFALVKKANLQDSIIRNTLATMEKAKQLEYLQQSGLFNTGFKILVEVHYYQDRDKSQTKFHKDTKGDTLFVNLNFINDEPVSGPEYVINPASDSEYDDYVERNLPAVFVEDIKSAREKHKDPTLIATTLIPVNGVVSFVDEAIHHKTPTLGHRTASSGAIRFALEKKYPKKYKEAAADRKKYRDRAPSWLWPTSAFDSTADASNWYKMMNDTEDSAKRFNRTELFSLFPQPSFFDVEDLIEQGGSNDFGGATFLHIKDKEGKPVLRNKTILVRKPEHPPLKRQMSQKLLDGTAPKPVPGKRTFFRTWVRAVKEVV